MTKNASEKLTYEKSSTKEVRKPRDIPNDVHDFIGQMLPHEYYFYRSIGLVTGKLFDAIVTGFILKSLHWAEDLLHPTGNWFPSPLKSSRIKKSIY